MVILWQHIRVLWSSSSGEGQCVAILGGARRRTYKIWTSVVVVLSAGPRPVRRAVVVATSRPLRRSTGSRVCMQPVIALSGGSSASMSCGVLPREALRSPLLRGSLRAQRVK